MLDVPLVEIAVAKGDSLGWAGRFVNLSHHSVATRRHLRRRPEVMVLDEGEEPVGTAATLRQLRPDLSQTVVTYNCDLLSDLSLPDLIEEHRRGHKACTLAVRSVSAGADLSLDDDGRAHLLNRHESSGAGLLFLGAACFERDALATIADEVPLGLVEGLLRPLIEARQVTLFEHPGYARDAGTLERYLEGSIDALDRAPNLVDPPGTISTNGKRCYVGPGAAVSEAFLGDGAIVLRGAGVGSTTRLTNCVVWPGSDVPSGIALAHGIWFEGSFLRA